ncbi:ribosomal L11 methyltransferase [Planoprotostelium fungivorum]|uniref:Ribosomal L11 methyltransferase n=1 Tax=Planoprotostelium fungivorum TaxID=1890364 RepID=A0A2P6NVH7_9EUKA|nr:ribosomal L11 methyltransferase [Planoprotostelium fungivorum]
MSWLIKPLEIHRKLIGDHIRNDAFFSAMKKVVKPKTTTVIDLGSGSGFLSFLATKSLDAKRCVLYESDPAAMSLSKELAHNNKITNLIFRNQDSREVKKSPHKGEVVISETLGTYALEENILETLRHGREFLTPDGIIIPGILRQYVAPVISSEPNDTVVGPWSSAATRYDLNLTAASKRSASNMYSLKIKPEQLGGDRRMFDEIDFNRDPVEQLKSVRKSPECTVYGFCVWWDAELVKGVTLSTSPYSEMTHWEQCYLPLHPTLKCDGEDVVSLTIESDSSNNEGCLVDWTTTQKKNGREDS